MNNAEYLLISRQLVNSKELEIVANNIANITPGFKKDLLLYTKKNINDMGKNIQYVKTAATIPNFSKGSIKETNRNLDIAIQDSDMEFMSFIGILTKNGIRYTRNGNLKLDSKFRIVDVFGNPVISPDGSEITLDSEDTIQMISHDGSVITENGQRGNIGIFTFQSNDLLSLNKDNNGYYQSNISPSTDLTVSQILHGVLEESNISYIDGVASLVQLQQNTGLISKLQEDIHNMRKRAYSSIAKL